VEKNIYTVSTTSPKRWFENMNMTSNCGVKNSAHKIPTTTTYN